MIEKNICPVCLTDEYVEKINIRKNYNCNKYLNFIIQKSSQKGNYSFFFCNDCHIIYSYPIINPGSEFYEKEIQDYKIGNLLNLLIDIWQYKEFFKNKIFPKGTLLDVGCGTGKFIYLAQNRGYKVTGIDFNKNSIEIAKEKYKLERAYDISIEELHKINDMKYDVITFFEVFEHLDQPDKFLRDVKGLLKNNGIICFSVPNRERKIPLFMDMDLPPHHLIHLNVKSIENILTKNGFKILKIIDDLKMDDIKLYIIKKTSLNVVKKQMLQIDENKITFFQKNIIFNILKMLSLFKSSIISAMTILLYPFFKFIYKKGITIFVIAKKIN